MALKCPECKSSNLGLSGKRWYKVGGRRSKRQQYICKDCGRNTVKPKG